MGLSLNHFLVLGALLFCIGLYGALTKRNAIAVLMGIEIMLNAVNITMVGFSFFNTANTPAKYATYLTGQIFAFFFIIFAAAEAGVGLGVGMVFFRKRETGEWWKIDILKG